VRMLRKLRWQLMLSYLPLILVPVLLVGLVTRVVAEQGLTLLVSQGAMQQARLLSDCFATWPHRDTSDTSLAGSPVRTALLASEL
jgi:hypothetical protein